MQHGYEVDVQICEDAQELAGAAAERIMTLCKEAMDRRGRFLIALSGGSACGLVYARLASPVYQDRLDWKKAEVFWVDERCVPPDHQDSNYRMAKELLLSKVQVPEGQIHRIRGEEDPAETAMYYGKEVSAYMPKSLFTFDLVILGMGADGHTAALFPGDAAASVTDKVAVPVDRLGEQHRRITLTLPVLNHAVAALFLVTGAEKAAAVREILDEGNPKGYPAGRVMPVKGELLWFLDRPAASLLSDDEGTTPHS
jgi:6-phosphogluconolactonase